MPAAPGKLTAILNPLQSLLLFGFASWLATQILNAQETPPKPDIESIEVAQKQEQVKSKTPTEKKAKNTDQNDKRLNVIEGKVDLLVEQVQALTEAMKSMSEKSAAEAATGEKSAETPKPAEDSGWKVDPNWLGDLPWRSIGPANMGGRITDIEIHGQDPSLWWLATASGGLLKSNNRGTTVEHQFDREATVSIGAVASDPRDKAKLWVGTGEINPRNSVSYGNGVYKSTDGGKSWTHVGLKDSYQISRILVHPKNSDVAYVGAQGRLYGTNEERGVFKTTDGGVTWDKMLYLDERTGVIDMIMHPEDPDTIIAAMWDRMRDGFDSWPGAVEKPEGIDGYDPIRKWGPKAGLYKTADGGKNWKKLTAGLPTGMIGRIGLDWQSKSPHTIYAVIDCEDIGKGPKPFDAFLGLVGVDQEGKAVISQVMPGSPAAKAGAKVGDILTVVEGQTIAKFDELLDVLRKKKVGARITLTLVRGEEKFELSPKLTVRPGSRTGAPSIVMGVVGEDRDGKITLTRVTKDGPADKAGLKDGDVIVKVDDETPKDYKTLIAEIQKKAIDDELKLSIARGGETMEITVVLAARPGTGPQGTAVMGIQGEDAEGGGAVLTVITEEGPSEKAGLKKGDVVTKLEGKKLASYEALIAEIRSRQPDDEMKLEVRRGEETVSLTVKLGDRNASGDNTRPYTYSYYGQQPNVQDQQGAMGHNFGGVYKSMDAGETWQRVNSINVRPMYFSVVRVDPSDDQRVYLLGVSQFQSDNGGVTFTSDLGGGVHSDCHDLWIDPNDGRHMVIGGDGGFYVTHDRGDNWDHINTAAIGQFYHVSIAPKKPFWVYGGLQDNGSWGGPGISKAGGALNEDWISVGGGDGFVCRADPQDPDLVYTESQNGSIRRRNLRTGESGSVRPARIEGKEYRFNWNTPFLLSNHNSRIFYSGGNYVFRSLDRGNDLQIISPEITLTKRGSATALSESPLDPNVLYAGTDDGALWVTQDGGVQWKNITENLGVDPRWVATIEASRFEEGRVFVCLDGHRSDDDRPLAFVSEDFGETFKSVTQSLPRGSTRCLREDIVNPDLLYLGTEFAFWVSLDRGMNWTQFNQKLPTVAVHEVAMHADVNEIVLATHGRSLWACDVTVLRGMRRTEVQKSIVLFEPSDVIRWRREPSRGRTNRRFAGSNPSSGAQIWYSLPQSAEKVALRIEDISGKVISTLPGKSELGLHSVSWNLTATVTNARDGRTRPTSVPSGDYRLVLSVDGKDQPPKVLSVKRDPTLPVDAISEVEFEAAMAKLEALTEEEEESGSSKDRDLK